MHNLSYGDLLLNLHFYLPLTCPANALEERASASETSLHLELCAFAQPLTKAVTHGKLPRLVPKGVGQNKGTPCAKGKSM